MMTKKYDSSIIYREPDSGNEKPYYGIQIIKNLEDNLKWMRSGYLFQRKGRKVAKSYLKIS